MQFLQPQKQKEQQIFWKDLRLRDMGDAFFQTCRRGIARTARCFSPASTQRGSWLCQRRGAVGSPVKKEKQETVCDFLLPYDAGRWLILSCISVLQSIIHRSNVDHHSFRSLYNTNQFDDCL